MKRYAIVSKTLPIDKLVAEATRVNAKNVKVANTTKQVFCELSIDQVKALSKIPDLEVKSLSLYTPDQLSMITRDRILNTAKSSHEPTSTNYQPLSAIWSIFHGIRSHFDPPLTGSGLTVAVLDTGIRKTHTSLQSKIVDEYNFSGSPGPDDIWGHGTQVAFIIAGGKHGQSMSGVSPGASIINVKVLSDSGTASDEEIVMGIEAICNKVRQCTERGNRPTDPEWPNVINLSLGAPDDGDPDNPVRKACRIASEEYGLDIVVSAGNDGPRMTTIRSPGTEPKAITVGAIEPIHHIDIWEKSSRGPTQEGNTKPDFVFWGVDIEAADNRSDTEYVTKSGTSFSAPILAGLTGLLWETGRLEYGEYWRFRWTEAIKHAEKFCVKPDNAPKVKGNTYGYGMPVMGTLMDQIIKGVPSDQEHTDTTQSAMMALLMLSLLDLMSD